jgi:hypothetical protein
MKKAVGWLAVVLVAGVVQAGPVERAREWILANGAEGADARFASCGITNAADRAAILAGWDEDVLVGAALRCGAYMFLSDQMGLEGLDARLTEVAALGPDLRAVPVVCRPSVVQPVCVETVRIDGHAGEWRPVDALAGGVGASVAAWGPITVFAGPVARTAPEYRAAASTAALDVDPFLTPYDVWKWGPLGDLRGEALEARERGDLGRFERLQALYWERLEKALERRRVLGGGRDGDGR